MEYPLDDQKMPYKGVFKKMLKRISERENHYLGFSNSLWKFAADLPWLALGDIKYFWSLDTWKCIMSFQGAGGWWHLERYMENSGMKANRKEPSSSWGSEKLPKLLEHIEEDPSWKATWKKWNAKKSRQKCFLSSILYHQSRYWIPAVEIEVGLEG